MSKPSSIGNKEIKSKAELIEWFVKGCTPADKLLIGVEHEKPPFYQDGHAPVPYRDKDGKKPGIKEIFEKMAAERDWRPGYEKGHIVDLQKDSVNWTLEPGGQIETGGAPLRNIHQSARETDEALEEIVEVADELGILLLALGYHPTHKGKDMPTMPKSRDETLRTYAEQHKFPFALEGMSCTSTVQVNLGYESEEDMVKKLRVALSLQPIVVSLFANSPFSEGKPTGFQSYRSHVIHNYMGGRFGFMLPVAFEEGFGFEKFVDYALNEMPLMGVYTDGVFIDAKGGTFGEFMEGKLEVCPGRKATMADWENHLNTIWPEVRLRRFLEMRGADNGPAEMIKALPAFWVGLLYDKQSLDAAYEMVRHWTDEDREYLRNVTPEKGLQTPFLNGTTTVQELAKNLLALADAGLKRRNIRDADGNDESIYLKPLHEIAESGKNWALRLLEKYNTDWKQDLSRIFNEQSYEQAPSVLRKAANENQPAASGLLKKPGGL